MDTVIQKSYFCFVENFVREHLELFLKCRVFIFGAGVRGRNFLCVLRLFGVPNIAFVDNNPRKWGTKIEECVVLSFPEAIKYPGVRVFLCPAENAQPMIIQLQQAGLKENIDYYNLPFQYSDYLDVVEEIKRPGNGYALAFGNCVVSSYVLGNQFVNSFGENMKEQLLGGDKGKVCSLPGLSTGIYFYILNTLFYLHGKKHLRFVFLTMEISCFSPYTPLLLGSQVYHQHKLFLEQLIELTPGQKGLEDYSLLIAERYDRSLSNLNLIKSFEIEKARKEVYELKYNFEIGENNESVIYTQKILELLNGEGIPVVLYFPPVDYQLGRAICGKDFTSHYSSIVNKIKSYLNGYMFDVIDASFLMSSDCFVQQMSTPDINPWLNEKGQKYTITFLKNQKAIQRGCRGANSCYEIYAKEY